MRRTGTLILIEIAVTLWNLIFILDNPIKGKRKNNKHMIIQIYDKFKPWCKFIYKKGKPMTHIDGYDLKKQKHGSITKKLSQRSLHFLTFLVGSFNTYKLT
jgi:hypothetical protein